jgi:porphobilinogen synthase
MPGVERMTIDALLRYIEQVIDAGIQCIALFPCVMPERVTNDCQEAWNPDNLICRAIREVKKHYPAIGIIADVALDPYNAMGHDGLVIDNHVANDETVEALIKQSLVQAAAGADILGLSDMMDGRVFAIRHALEQKGFHHTMIMSYAAKYASSLYSPFRGAIGSKNMLKGDKKSYQLDPANSSEALRKAAMDIQEGADMIIVKPGMMYLDICRTICDAFSIPTFAYQVSGEYAMITAACENGWLNRNDVIIESLMAFRRSGCDGIVTYFALEAAHILHDSCWKRG